MTKKIYERNGSSRKRLEGKVAIITGAGTGIGEAIAHKFAWEGARVIVNGLPDDPIADVAKAICERGGEAIPKAGDVSDENSAWACVELALTKYERLDILINNAGVFLDNAMTEDYPLEDFDRTIRMNIRSAFMMTRFSLPHLQKTREHRVGGIGIRYDWAGAKYDLRWNERLDARLHARGGGRAGAKWCASELRMSWANRHGMDA
jgi:NAD(P)-dependent dehydrogenase (short-subunit alcohol dehydrogenase family)